MKQLLLRLKVGFFSILLFIFHSCKEKPFIDSLESGLSGYLKSRLVNETMKDDFTVNKWAYRQIDSVSYNFIFLLDNDTQTATVEKYGFGMVYFPKNLRNQDKNYIFYHATPTIVQHGGYKYILDTVQPPSRELDSIRIFLTSRKEYDGVVGNVITLNNIFLR